MAAADIGERVMPYQAPKHTETVRRIKIKIGKDWSAIDFGREIPRGEAMKRARQILETLA